VNFKKIKLASVVTVVIVFFASLMINVQPMSRSHPEPIYIIPPEPFARPSRPMRLLSEEEMEQRGLTRDIISVDQVDGVEVLIIDPDSLP